MITSAKVAILGGDDLLASVIALGLEPVRDDPEVALIDMRDHDAVVRAATLPRGLPRVIIASSVERELLAALGADPAHVAASADPAVIGPMLLSLIPTRPRRATRIVAVTGVRGGVGRTMLATNLALRLSSKLRVCVIDATGTGAVAWWFDRTPRPWSALEGMVDEMSSDHLSVAAEDVRPNLRLVGGPSVAPTSLLLAATMRAATVLDDLVLIDTPIVANALALGVLEAADRSLVLAYDDPWSSRLIAELPVGDDDLWLIASQSKAAKIGGREVFRALPRDESAVASAVTDRGRVKGSLGRSYDALAELLLIDAT